MVDRGDICILIAASQLSLRKSLKMFLNEENGMCVVAEAGDSHELLKKVEATCPDVVLLEWDLLDRATPILIKAILPSLIVITKLMFEVPVAPELI